MYFAFSTTFAWKVSHSKRNSARHDQKCTLLFIVLVSCSWKLNFLDRFSKKIKYQISWKSDEWEPSCSMRTERRTDNTELTVAFRNFANAPENWWRNTMEHCPSWKVVKHQLAKTSAPIVEFLRYVTAYTGAWHSALPYPKARKSSRI